MLRKQTMMYWMESVLLEHSSIRKKILIYKDCENLIREFSSYVWDIKAVERGEDKPVKKGRSCNGCIKILLYDCD